MKEISLDQVVLDDTFWRSYQELVITTTIPYQYAVLNDNLAVDVQAERQDDTLPAGKSHALENLRILAGLKTGEHFGWFFQDSDVYKWLEATGYALITQPNAQLENLADEVIDLLALAQDESGYINSYFQLKFPKLKYRQLYFSHELYCAGHLIEAAISYTKATGKQKLLKIAEKFVQNIQQNFGMEKGKIQGADGHQEIELALVKLYEFTNNQEYLALAEFFINIRGQDPQFYQKQIMENYRQNLCLEQPKVDLVYMQADCPVEKQTYAKGHAVRMLYMACGMAKVVQYTNNLILKDTCIQIWKDIVEHKMFITGGVGSTVLGEAFVGNYDLPNDTMYCETCAGVALVNFCFEMFKLTKEFKYIDTLERALYNVVLAGAAVDGKHFFYVNPLEVSKSSCKHNPTKGHVKLTRPDWLGCACCPPNFARIIASLQRYIYCQDLNEIWINLFIPSKLATDDYKLTMVGDFPYTDTLTINYQGPTKKCYIRKPYWQPNLKINTNFYYQEFNDYIEFNLTGSGQIQILLEQDIKLIYANPAVLQTINHCSIQRGPFIYCIEDVDQSYWVHSCRVQPNSFKCDFFINKRIINKTMVIKFTGYSASSSSRYQTLYSNQQELLEKVTWYAIPYHLWGNRKENDMRIWLPLALLNH